MTKKPRKQATQSAEPVTPAGKPAETVGLAGTDKAPIAVATPQPRARTRACRELGERFAELLQAPHSHQLGVCARLGIAPRTHFEWMAKDSSADDDLADYQREVLAGLDRQRVADLEDIDATLETAEAAKASTLWNVRKHRHESRFKRFYEADAQKHEVELTGKDGGAIQVAARPMTRAEALREALADPDVLAALRGSAEAAGLLTSGDGEDVE